MSLFIDRTNDQTTKIRKPERCDGCGRFLPKGSEVHRRYVSEYGDKWKFDWCDSCWRIIKECWTDKIDVINGKDVRHSCKSCDNYSLCEKAEYLKNSKPGDTTMECIR